MTDTPSREASRENGWTPGPWEAWFRDSLSQPPGRLCEATWYVGNDEMNVAEVFTHGRKTEDQVAADARLIAAAPEMAELLERAKFPKGADAMAAHDLLARIHGEAP